MVRGMTRFTAPQPGRLDALVKTGFTLSNNKARAAIRTGKITVDGARVLDIGHPTAEGAQIVLDMTAPNPARTEPHGVRLLLRDDHLVVLAKPAGLLSAPVPNSEEPSALVAAQLFCKGPRRPKVVHRLDRETSGLLVFARSVVAARALQAAIQSRTMRRTYACVTDGIPPQPEGLIASMLMRDRGDGRRGSREGTLRVRPLNQPAPGPQPGSGQHSVTRYKVIMRKGDRCAAEVRLSTGRTHQIRIHMAEIGSPVLGEPVYVRGGARQHRQALHAMRLSFRHPASGQPLEFFDPWPADLAGVRPVPKAWQAR